MKLGISPTVQRLPRRGRRGNLDLNFAEQRHAQPCALFGAEDCDVIVIVGCIVVIGAVLGGFTMAGGHMHSLIHPSEIVTIGGASLGALIVMSPKKVLIDLFKGMLQTIKGSPFNKAMYADLFRLMYDLLRTARREGLLGLEVHVSHPHDSTIFNKYPRDRQEPSRHRLHLQRPDAAGRRHRPQGAAAGAVRRRPQGASRKSITCRCSALQKTADAPAGLRHRRGRARHRHHDGSHRRPRRGDRPQGRRRAGRHVPRHSAVLRLLRAAGRPHGADGHRRDRRSSSTIATIIIGFANELPPKVAIDQARRGVGTEMRPTREELEEMFKEVDAIVAGTVTSDR